MAGVAHGEPLRPATSHTGWQYDIDTFLQVDAVPWNQLSQDEISPSGAPLNEDRVSIRRGLFRVVGKHDDLRVQLELDGDTTGGTPSAGIFTAFVAWAPRGDLVELAAGLFQIPFGIETPKNARDRVFMEQPAFLRAYFPGDRDAGGYATGEYGFLRWSLAAVNGSPVADAMWKGKDPTSSYDVLGRVGGELHVPTMWGRPRFRAGVSALTGTSLHPGIPPTKDQLVWVDENMDGIVQPTEIQVIPGTPGEPSQKFHHDALGADASVAWCLQWAGAGEAFFEGALATNLDRGIYYADPVASSRDLRELGYMVGAVQHLTPRALVGVRYDYYDADRDASKQLGTTLVGTHRVFTTWALLAAVQRGTARLSLEYDHARNPLGLADNGVPTTIEADQIVARVQAEF